MKNSSRTKRGVALITAMLMSVIFLALIGALMSQMIGELQMVGAHGNSAKALDAAYAGVENMVLKIEENASGPGHVAPAPISYNYPAPSTVKYDVSVIKTWNSSSGLVYYEIKSTGTETNSGQTRSVLALTKSFPYSYYEQFTAGSSSNIYYTSGEHFDGPVYNGSAMNVWYQDPSSPIFNSSVQTAQTPNFYQGAAKTPVAMSAVNWADVMLGGTSSNLKVSSNPMQLPTFQDNLALASESYWGDGRTITNVPVPPGGNGVYINQTTATAGTGSVKTGLFIEGNVKITPSSPTATTEQFLLQPNPAGITSIPYSYTVTVDFSAKTTTVTQTSGCTTCPTATYTGVISGQPAFGSPAGNGAIFADGNVDLVSGVIHGDYSVAVPDYTSNHGHNITITGAAPGIVYKDQTSTSTDEFGIWANDVKLNVATTTGYEFDGSIMTGFFGQDNPPYCPGAGCLDGNFSNQGYNGSVQGTFTFYGGLIQNSQGAMGITSGGTLIHGFKRQYQYDSRLAANPPPGFPITNRYDIIAWLDQGK
jgi:hypothetical protein